jgi:hypothetical protein
VKNRAGLTLVDMMIALTVLAILLAAVYAVFAFQNRTADAAAEGRDAYGQGLFIMDRIGRDLGGAWLPEAAGLSPGMVFRFQATETTLDLATTSSLTLDQTRGPEVVEAGYRLALNEEAARAGGRQKYILYRRQDDIPDSEPDEGGSEIVLSEEVLALNITYLGPGGREDEAWTAERYPDLPRGARIELTLEAEDGAEEQFLTRVELPLAMWPVRPIAIPFGFGSNQGPGAEDSPLDE